MAVCTIFVFSSLMEYALVNVVMGDEGGEESALKKGFKNILIATRTTPASIQVNVDSLLSFSCCCCSFLLHRNPISFQFQVTYLYLVTYLHREIHHQNSLLIICSYSLKNRIHSQNWNLDGKKEREENQ